MTCMLTTGQLPSVAPLPSPDSVQDISVCGQQAQTALLLSEERFPERYKVKASLSHLTGGEFEGCG